VTAKADPWAQLRLLDLQALDTRLDQIAHRVRTMPEHAEIAVATATLTELADRAVVARTEADDLAKLVRKAESDVEQVRNRAARDQQLLDSGSITSAKQLEELSHEVGSLARRQADLEDVELEVMEQLEAAQAATTAVEAERAGVAAALDAATARRDEQVAELEAEAAAARTERTEVVDGVPADLLALYEKLRVDNGGVGAAKLQHGKCGGCHMELNPTDLGRIRSAASDEVVRCEECRRILVRASDSGL